MTATLAAPSAAPPTITAEQVRAGVERECRALAALGIVGLAAEPRAVAIARAKIANSPALAERQMHEGRCHVCGDPLDDSAPVVAVMTGAPRQTLFMHRGRCHAEHIDRHAARVDALMTAAGFAPAASRSPEPGSPTP